MIEDEIWIERMSGFLFMSNCELSQIRPHAIVVKLTSKAC